MPQQYIGVYATKETAPSAGEFPRPHGTRKRLWFVWETPEGKYTVQALNAAMQPMSEARVITAKDFSGRYVYEDDCFAAPEGFAHPMATGMDAATVSLPDLFVREKRNDFQASAASGRGLKKGGVQADDPNLLREWVRAEPQAGPTPRDPVKIPFDRLVGEVVAEPDGPIPDQEKAAARTETTPKPVGAEEPEQVRRLRSRFVQALLLLRRGAKSEGVTVLEELLAQPYESFEGGAQLFSEFGLGLRRLGFTKLAFAAHKRALEFAPGDARVLFNLARSCHDLELFSEAGEYLEQALAAAPDFAAARQFLAFLGMKKSGHAE